MFTSRAELETTSPAYDAMVPYWNRVAAIRGGLDEMRANASELLPKFPGESAKNYEFRVKNARFTDIFSDILENMATKPFKKEVTVKVAQSDQISKQFEGFAENVDGANNHLTIFSQRFFEDAIERGIEWILVDFPDISNAKTLADIRKANARPYWVRVPSDTVLMAMSDIVDGGEQLVYFKIKESAIVTDEDGKQKLVDQFRIFSRIKDDESGQYSPAQYEIWRATGEQGSENEFELIASNVISIGVIPAVPLVIGNQENNQYLTRPPLRNIVDLQVEYFQEENGLKAIKNLTAFPMYVGRGMDAPVSADGQPVEVTVGAGSMLFTGSADKDLHLPDIALLEPQGASLNFLADQLSALEDQMRELGRMPMTAGTAGITQVAAAMASQKASSALQAWAYKLKDALEKAMALTALWLGYTPAMASPEVYVNTDFEIDIGDSRAMDYLIKMRQDRDISRETLRYEAKRRGLLSPDYDPDKDDSSLADEADGDGFGEFESIGSQETEITDAIAGAVEENNANLG